MTLCWVPLGLAQAPADETASTQAEETASPTTTENAEAAATVQQLADTVASLEARLAEAEARLSARPGEEETVAAGEDDAELAAFLDAQQDSEVEALTGTVTDEPLRVYGFFDLGVNRLYFPETTIISTSVASDVGTFVLGNLNVYLDAHPAPRWHALAEIRFSLYPNGVPVLADGKYAVVDTSVIDYTSPTGRNFVDWGGIVLERVWAQWMYSDLLQVRAGLFFTPYGIWNQDHGTPVLLGLVLPDFYSEEYFPTRLTGLQFLGSWQTGSVEYGYAAYITNGRTPFPYDVDEDKGIGGRLYAEMWRPYRLKLGLSGYMGTYEELERTFRLDADGDPVFDVERKVEYDEWAAAADLSLDLDQFGLRSELVVSNVEYTPGRRKPAFGAPGLYAPDTRRWNFYVAPSYRIGSFTPYLWLESTAGHIGADVNFRTFTAFGTNIDFEPKVKLKGQFGYYSFFNRDGFDFDANSKKNFYVFSLRLAVMF